jgi:hypothetical protein
MLSLKGPDINELQRLLKIRETGSGDVDLFASLAPKADGPLALGIRGNLGRATINADATLSDLKRAEEIDATLEASGPDLGQILSLFGMQNVREAPFTVDLDLYRDGPMLAIDRAQLEVAEATFDLTAKLPTFPGLDTGNARLQISGPEFARLRELLALPGAAEGPFSLGLELYADEDGEEMIRIGLESTLADIQAQGRVAHGPNYAGSVLDFTISIDSLDRFAGVYGINSLPDVPASIAGSVEVTEHALRLPGPLQIAIDEVRAEVEGRVALAGKLNGSRLSFAVRGPDLSEIVGLVKHSKWVPTLPVELRGGLELADGELRFRKVSGTLGRSTVDIDGRLRPGRRVAGSRFEVDAAGPAFEELLGHIPDVAVREGHYDLGGEVEFYADGIRFNSINLSRERGEIALDLDLGLPRLPNRIDFDLEGQGGSLRAIVAALGAFEFDDAAFTVAARGKLRDTRLALAGFDVGIGNASVFARGDLNFAAGAKTSDLDVDVNIPSLARLGAYEGRRLQDQPLVLKADLRGSDSALSIGEVEIRLGGSDLRGTAELRTDGLPELIVEADSNVVLLESPMEASEPKGDPEAGFGDGRLIPDVSMPFETLSKFNASLVLNVAELRRASASLRDVALSVSLRDGGLELREFRALGVSGSLRARGALLPRDDSGIAELALRATDFSSGMLAATPNASARLNIEARVEASGADLRTLVGNAGGAVFVDARNLVAPRHRLLKRIYGDVLKEIVGAINPFSNTDPDARIQCVVVPLAIDAGKVETNPQALISTDKVRILSKSAIDLDSEMIDLNFRTMPRKGFTISAGEILNPYVKVVGTLAEPRLALDKKGGLVSGGAAFATGGLSIFARAAWNRLARSNSPCDTAAELGVAALEDRFAEWAEDGVRPD